jgi:hypothetical protein
MSERLFSEEAKIADQFQGLLKNDSLAGADDYKMALSSLSEKYKELLDQTKFLTKISDRLENRLHTANQSLEEKNIELKETLDELTKARVGKKAFTIIYVIAAFLFVFEEYFVGPFLGMMGNLMLGGILIKLAIALLLKPAESLLENSLLKRLVKNKRNGARS